MILMTIVLLGCGSMLYDSNTYHRDLDNSVRTIAPIGPIVFTSITYIT